MKGIQHKNSGAEVEALTAKWVGICLDHQSGCLS